MKNNGISSLLFSLSYAIGVVIGLYLIVIAGWADMESAFYGFTHLGDSGLDGFSCPVLMTRAETRMISLTVSNTTDRRLNPTIKTDISTPVVMSEVFETIELAPGESKTLKWSVGPENIDLERFIFAKVLMFSAYPLPSQEVTCGIFILDLPGSGRVILAVLVALSLLGMSWGLYGLSKIGASNQWLKAHIRPMLFLEIVIISGFVVSFMVGWVPSILILAVAVLLIVILLSSLLMNENIKP